MDTRWDFIAVNFELLNMYFMGTPRPETEWETETETETQTQFAAMFKESADREII